MNHRRSLPADSKIMNKKFINLILISIMLPGAFACKTSDIKASVDNHQNHKALSESTWSGVTGKEIKDRILTAPDIIIDYLIAENRLQGFRERPQKAEINEKFFSDIIAAITELPPSVKNHIHEHLVALFLVKELGGTGFCELLRNFDNNRLGFIVIDVDVLCRKANEWASWKENSPFSLDGKHTLAAKIEQKRNNSRKAAIQYILLHEIGHLIGVAKGAHPNWMKGGDPRQWPFSCLSWLTWEGGLKGKSKFDGTFPNREKIKYYSSEDARLASSEIDNTYDQLLGTDFVSLYAATNMYDDFAETYAMYVHVVLQNRPWEIRIIKNGKVIRTITNPILAKRCEAKKRYLDRIFE